MFELFSTEEEAIDFDPILGPTIQKWMVSKKKEHSLIGGRGSGKTYGLIYKIATICQTYPGTTGDIYRGTLKDIKETMLPTFFDLIPSALIDSFDKQNSIVWMKSGPELESLSKIQFIGIDRQMQAGGGRLQTHGRERNFVGVEEVSELGDNDYIEMTRQWLMMLRHTATPRHWLMTVGNPGGHNAHWRRHNIDAGHEDRDFFIVPTRERPTPTKADEERLAEYVQTIIDAYPADLVKRYLEGNCDIDDGRVFPEFSETHIISDPVWIEEFDRQKQFYETKMVIDYGYANNPTVCIWGAVMPDGSIIIYQEYTALDKKLEEVANDIIAISSGKEDRLIDPATNFKNREGDSGFVSVKDDLAKYGLETRSANNDVNNGIVRMKELLHPHPRLEHIITGKKPGPRLYFIGSRVPIMIEQLKDYYYGKIRINGTIKPAKNQKDDTVDALRYMVSDVYLEVIGDETAIDKMDSTQRRIIRDEEHMNERENNQEWNYEGNEFLL